MRVMMAAKAVPAAMAGRIRCESQGQKPVGDGLVADGGQPAQLDGKDDDQQDAQPKVGHAQAHKGREGNRMIQERVSSDGRDDAGCERDGQGDGERQEGQGQGPGDRLADDAAHSHVAAIDGIAQVALEHVPHPEVILDVDRLVVAPLGLERLGRRRVDVGQHGGKGIARDGAQQKEHQGDHQPDHDEGMQHPLDQIARHGTILFSSASQQRTSSPGELSPSGEEALPSMQQLVLSPILRWSSGPGRPSPEYGSRPGSSPHCGRRGCLSDGG